MSDFDEFARTIGAATSRRGALKLIGGVTVAAVAATVLRPFRADAVTCSGPSTAGAAPCAAGTTPCGACCCKSGVACLDASRGTCGCPAGTTPCGSACCKAGVACKSTGAQSTCAGAVATCLGTATPCGTDSCCDCCSPGAPGNDGTSFPQALVGGAARIYSASNPEACCRACQADPQCNAWAFNPGVCQGGIKPATKATHCIPPPFNPSGFQAVGNMLCTICR